MIIRYAEQRDAEQLNELYNHYIRTSIATFDIEPWPLEKRERWIESHPPRSRHIILVALEDDDSTLLGFAASSTFRDKAAYDSSVESSIYIAPEDARRGIARSLYTKLLDTLRERSVHRVYACLAVPNEPSVRLHESLGFRFVGQFSESGYKHGTYRDIQWFEKAL